jgi:hypothetical protein
MLKSSWREGAMRNILAFLVFCLMASNALAQTAGNYHFDVVAYGIISGTDGVPVSVSSSGIVHREGGMSHVIQTTTRIPACIGTKFGFVFSIAGAPAGTRIHLSQLDKFPPSGLHKPDALFPIHEDRFEYDIIAGTHRKAIYYAFDHPWELVPGEWTFELRDGYRLLASKTFIVVAMKKAECPTPIS